MNSVTPEVGWNPGEDAESASPIIEAVLAEGWGA